MGPTKAFIRNNAIYDVKNEKLIQMDFANLREMERYITRHYIVLPEVDKAGKEWKLDGKRVYCFRGSRYETSDDHREHLVRCPACGGMGVRVDEMAVETDCIRCTQCGYECDARLEMMES
jgi:hypothetical protein